MKYTCDFLENKKVLVGGVEKEIKEGTFTDEQGNQIKATIWRFDKDNVEFPNYANIAPGSTLEANPWSKPGSTNTTLYAPKLSSTGASRAAPRAKVDVEGHRQVQAEISKNVHAAQDRAAWMYAKNNASMLLANDPNFYKFGGIDRPKSDLIADAVIYLATKIYNGEPTEPFSSPSKVDDDLAGLEGY